MATGKNRQTAHDDWSRREREILECLRRGLSNKEAAAHLCVSVPTVKHYVRKVLRRYGCGNRYELLAKILKGDAG